MTIKPLGKPTTSDLAAKAKAGAQKPSVATSDEKDGATTWGNDKPPKKPGTRFTQTFSTKTDPDVISEFDAIVDEKGLKKAAAIDQALKMWIAENK